MSESISTTSPALTVLWGATSRSISPENSPVLSRRCERANDLDLLTHIATTESVSLCVRIEKLTAFLELQRITRNGSD